jgi:hypothetical protein
MFVPEACVCGSSLDYSDPCVYLAVADRIPCDEGSRSREISYLGLWTTDSDRRDCETRRGFDKVPCEADAAMLQPEKYC